MKIWECIEEISSDRSKKFESKINNKEVIMKWENYALELVRKNSNEFYPYTITEDVLQADWELIEEPCVVCKGVKANSFFIYCTRCGRKLEEE